VSVEFIIYYYYYYLQRFLTEGVAEGSQIISNIITSTLIIITYYYCSVKLLLRDAHVLSKLFSYEKYYRRARWLVRRRAIAIHLKCECCSSLVAFYDIHRKRVDSFFLSRTPHETIYKRNSNLIIIINKEKVYYSDSTCVHRSTVHRVTL
jgi:hypothetical protein